MTPVVASLALTGRKPGEADVALTVEIGTPYQVGKGEWACPVSVRPLYGDLRDAHGGDSFQAMFLAMRLALSLLKDFNDKGGAVLMVGEEGLPGGDGGFPFEAYTIDFEKNR